MIISSNTSCLYNHDNINTEFTKFFYVFSASNVGLRGEGVVVVC